MMLATGFVVVCQMTADLSSALDVPDSSVSYVD
jgi:hypothetical protein